MQYNSICTTPFKTSFNIDRILIVWNDCIYLLSKLTVKLQIGQKFTLTTCIRLPEVNILIDSLTGNSDFILSIRTKEHRELFKLLIYSERRQALR